MTAKRVKIISMHAARAGPSSLVHFWQYLDAMSLDIVREARLKPAAIAHSSNHNCDSVRKSTSAWLRDGTEELNEHRILNLSLTEEGDCVSV